VLNNSGREAKYRRREPPFFGSTDHVAAFTGEKIDREIGKHLWKSRLPSRELGCALRGVKKQKFKGKGDSEACRRGTDAVDDRNPTSAAGFQRWPRLDTFYYLRNEEKEQGKGSEWTSASKRSAR